MKVKEDEEKYYSYFHYIIYYDDYTTYNTKEKSTSVRHTNLYNYALFVCKK